MPSLRPPPWRKPNQPGQPSTRSRRPLRQPMTLIPALRPGLRRQWPSTVRWSLGRRQAPPRPGLVSRRPRQPPPSSPLRWECTSLLPPRWPQCCGWTQGRLPGQSAMGSFLVTGSAVIGESILVRCGTGCKDDMRPPAHSRAQLHRLSLGMNKASRSAPEPRGSERQAHP